MATTVISVAVGENQPSKAQPRGGYNVVVGGLVHKMKLQVGIKIVLPVLISLLIPLKGWAAPPVRIAVVPANGSGIEQEAVDRISNQVERLSDVVLSTVNPDWYVVCNIQERSDQASGQIRYNGTVTIKTLDGQVIKTISCQKYNQDFSLQPGAPLNKQLVDSAAREVISGMSDRAAQPIQQAVQIEIETRDRVLNASQLADGDKYADAIALLAPITPDTTHFHQVRAMIVQFQIEQRALELIASAEHLAKQGRYQQAIGSLQQVDKKSKRFRVAQGRIQAYRAELVRLNLRSRH